MPSLASSEDDTGMPIFLMQNDSRVGLVTWHGFNELLCLEKSIFVDFSTIPVFFLKNLGKLHCRAVVIARE